MSTKQEIMGVLDELEVEYDPKAKKADLEALIPTEEEEVEEAPASDERDEEEKDAEVLAETLEAGKTVVEETAKKKDLGPYAGKELGTSVVYTSRDVEINGKKYIEVSLVNGTTTVLSKKDLETQLDK